MSAAATKVAEAGRWVAVLSLDDPLNQVLPWRWFCATGWMMNAVMEAIPQGGMPAPTRLDQPAETAPPRA